MIRYWDATTPTAPSRAVERGVVPDIAALLDLAPCAGAELHDAILAGTEHKVFMHRDGGWGGGTEFKPTMLMSFYDGATDHVTPVISGRMARGELYLLRCDGGSAWVAHWPNCGNLALLELADGTGAPDAGLTGGGDPVSVAEPGTLGLVLVGVVLIGWINRRTET